MYIIYYPNDYLAKCFSNEARWVYRYKNNQLQKRIYSDEDCSLFLNVKDVSKTEHEETLFLTLSDKQFSNFKNNTRLCALTYKLSQAFQSQAQAIYGDDKYADLTIVVTACCLADQFLNVIGKKAPSKVMSVFDVIDYVDDFSDAEFLKFQNDKVLEKLSNNLTDLLYFDYKNHLYGDNPKEDLNLMLHACQVANRYRNVTVPKVKHTQYVSDSNTY